MRNQVRWGVKCIAKSNLRVLYTDKYTLCVKRLSITLTWLCEGLLCILSFYWSGGVQALTCWAFDICVSNNNNNNNNNPTTKPVSICKCKCTLLSSQCDSDYHESESFKFLFVCHHFWELLFFYTFGSVCYTVFFLLVKYLTCSCIFYYWNQLFYYTHWQYYCIFWETAERH